jgi:hypothetical protein
MTALVLALVASLEHGVPALARAADCGDAAPMRPPFSTHTATYFTPPASGPAHNSKGER